MNQSTKLPPKAPVATSRTSPGVAVKTSRTVKPKVAPKTAKATPKPAVKIVAAKKPSVAAKTAKVAPALAAKNSKPVQAKVAPKVAPAITSVQPAKSEKKKRQKMVRDSFNMPESDYDQIAALKKRCLKAGVSAKKSELLRAALKCLSGLSDPALTKAIAELEPIKAGRPAKR